MENYVNMLKELCRSDFNCGYMTALLLVVALFVILMVLRFILWLLFRTRRCTEVVIHQADGSLVIAKDAVFTAIRQDLADYPQLRVRQLKLYRKGNNYRIDLCGSYCQEEKSGLPELSDRFKQQIRDMLSRTLGISNLKSLNLKVEELEAGYRAGTPAAQPEDSTPELSAEPADSFTPSDEK